ncbi:hypothetical protein [Sporichthya sp.]|uniref:hypothetical protein n=1 Tax=Sporichthya sp. TaxID=65475 RepID=UPI0017ACA864|nr:hypothetical protein [Sporichthya sp.]MBA3745173.1 hypothetical protein [Sporichthya sp.]
MNAPIRPRARAHRGDASVSDSERRYLTAPVPWQRRELVESAVVAGVGLVVLTAGYLGSAREETLGDQIGWLILALVGLAVALLGPAGFTTAGFRHIRRAVRELTLDAADHYPAISSRSARGTPLPAGTDGDLVTSDAMNRVHRSDCLLMRGKPARPAAAREASALKTCGVCGS